LNLKRLSASSGITRGIVPISALNLKQKKQKDDRTKFDDKFRQIRTRYSDFADRITYPFLRCRVLCDDPFDVIMTSFQEVLLTLVQISAGPKSGKEVKFVGTVLFQRNFFNGNIKMGFKTM